VSRLAWLAGAALLAMATRVAAQQPAPAATKPAPASSGAKISGYLQARTTYQDRVGLTSSINRARVTIAGGIATHFTWRVQGEFRTGSVGPNKASVRLTDAYIRYQRNELGIQAGQFKVPFTREYITALADLETADRSTVVDSLSPKRDIGLMANYAFVKRVTLTVAVFNGEGENVTANKDSTLLGAGRLVMTPMKDVSVGVNALRYFGDSTRYGADVAYEGPLVTMKSEYLRQYRDSLGKPEDHGWFALAGIKPLDWLQLVGKYEEFERPGVSAQQKNRAWTAGANFFLAGPAIKLYLEYISRRIGDPGVRTGMLLAQLQARF
jgi:phosphate-selective porin